MVDRHLGNDLLKKKVNQEGGLRLPETEMVEASGSSPDQSIDLL
jgi:hypothetical protein